MAVSKERQEEMKKNGKPSFYLETKTRWFRDEFICEDEGTVEVVHVGHDAFTDEDEPRPDGTFGEYKFVFIRFKQMGPYSRETVSCKLECYDDAWYVLFGPHKKLISKIMAQLPEIGWEQDNEPNMTVERLIEILKSAGFTERVDIYKEAADV